MIVYSYDEKSVSCDLLDASESCGDRTPQWNDAESVLCRRVLECAVY